jgi:hypothetical protein
MSESTNGARPLGLLSRAARLDPTLALRGLDHRDADPVLHAPAGIQAAQSSVPRTR